jgi:acyl carrier protein
MEAAHIYGKLEEVVADSLDLTEVTLHPSTVAGDVDGWDSANNVRIMIAVEEAFGIEFSTGEVTSLKNVGQLATLIANKTAAR